MNKSFALITGASSGIGLEIAIYLAKKGYNLVLTARRENKLLELSNKLISDYKVEVDYLSSDLSNPDSPNDIYNFCNSKNYFIEILINNAGYGVSAPLHESSMEDEEKCIRVLAISVIALTKLFIPVMIKKGGGKIMIVSSVAAFAPPSAIQSLYGPTKTFMNRFSEAINLSYNRNGIFSTAVCPGFTVTNFHTASGVQDEMDKVPKFLVKSAKRVSKEGVDGMFNRKRIVVPTKTWKIIAFLMKTLPYSFFLILSSIIAPGRFNK